MNKLILIAILICGFQFRTSAQVQTDSTVVNPDYTYEKKNSFKSVFYGQPGDAAAWSLLLPGAGQLYNKRWWKAPLIWAGEGFLVWNLDRKLDTYRSWDQCWQGIVEDNSITTCSIEHVDGNSMIIGIQNVTTNQSNAFEERQNAKSARELAWIFFVAGHLIQTLEAFVDRHLINFDTSPDLGGLQFEQADKIIYSNQEVWQIPVFSVRLSLN